MHLFLHIGTAKTGTTSIQKNLHKNRGILADHGIFYPSEFDNHIHIPLHFMDEPEKQYWSIKNNLHSRKEVRELTTHRMDNMLREMNKGRYNKAILSSELLQGLDRFSIASLKNFFSSHFESINIVCYVRDPIGYATSMVQQKVKTGTASIQEKLDHPDIQRYSRLLGEYGNAFGRENVIVREFHRQAMVDGDAVSDFLDAIGESANLINKEGRTRQNDSICYESMLIADEFNKIRPRKKDGTWNPDVSKDFQFSLLGIPGTKFHLPDEVREKVWKESKEEVKWIREFSGKKLFSHTHESKYEPPKWDQEMLFGLGELINHLLLENQRLREANSCNVIKNIAKKIVTYSNNLTRLLKS